MEISLKNIKNIKELKFQIEDRKVNFIFGISGSGKSTVAEALTKEYLPGMLRIGSNENDYEVKVNDSVVNTNEFEIYNSEVIDSLLKSDLENNFVYEVLSYDNSEVKDNIKNYQKDISELQYHKKSLIKMSERINNLAQYYGAKLVKEQTKINERDFKLTKLIKNIESVSSISIFDKALIYGIERTKWIYTGTKYLNDEMCCPFCESKLSSETIKGINEIGIFKEKQFEVALPDKSIFSGLPIKVPNLKNQEEVQDFQIKLTELLKLSEDIKLLLGILETEIPESEILSIEFKSDFYQHFPDLKKIVENMNSKISIINEKRKKIQVSLSNVISRNLETLNSELKVLGIPYEFKKTSYSYHSKKAKYSLCHINDKETDRYEGLSSGEKYLVTLILFIIRKGKRTIILDDPVSSFDDFRRKTIFSLIFKYQTNNTVLVLSHDHVFAKFAVQAKEEGSKVGNLCLKKHIGIIKYFNNFNQTPLLIDILKDDFIPLRKLYLQKINQEMNHYRKALYLRMMFEIEKYRSNKIRNLTYTYLSKILHKVEYRKIVDFLTENQISEQKVLKYIKYKTGVTFDSLPENYISLIGAQVLTNFEKIFLLRLDGEINALAKVELDSLVHLNSAYAISLDPFKFNYYSPYIHQLLSDFQ